MQVFGPNELLQDVLNRDFCIGCGACVDLCPYFRNFRGKTSMLFPCTLPRGRCFAYCPKAEVDLDALAEGLLGRPYDGSPLGELREVVAARGADRADLQGCQEGGTVTTLVTLALESGRIEAAALTDRRGVMPFPRLVTDPSEVKACASSKYAAAPSLAALNRAVRQGHRKIGVVGTPCQVTATAQMRLNPLEEENFSDPTGLVIGLFCTWALDARGLEALLERRLDTAKIRAMDLPPPPSERMIVETEDGERLEIPLEEIRPLVPPACRICPDMTSEFADLSVGVMEGRPGWNTLIVRTERGAELVEEARRLGRLETEPIPEENLEHLREAAANKKARALRSAGEEGVLNRTEEGTRSALRLRQEIVEKILS